MILCPNCHNKELPGAYFCSECGTQLMALEFLNTRMINKPVEESLISDLGVNAIPTRKIIQKPKDPNISLHLVESGKVIHLSEKKDFTLGRAVEGQSILPDVDLSAYEAFSLGVSRMHVSLRILNGDVYVMDLGSSNGTKINGQKIVQHVEYSISHGDLVTLGRLKVQVLLIR
ncbi:MAG: FHA protein [uncultured bacterium]|nr:MAG: FHA protein [uncultured bacterium]